MIDKDIQPQLCLTLNQIANGRYIYKGTRGNSINNDNNLWLYFGTGDTQKLQDQSNKVKNKVFLV